MVLEDDEDDFRRASVDSGSGTKRGKTGGGGEIGETKRKRRRKRIMDSGTVHVYRPLHTIQCTVSSTELSTHNSV